MPVHSKRLSGVRVSGALPRRKHPSLREEDLRLLTDERIELVTNRVILNAMKYLAGILCFVTLGGIWTVSDLRKNGKEMIEDQAARLTHQAEDIEGRASSLRTQISELRQHSVAAESAAEAGRVALAQNSTAFQTMMHTLPTSLFASSLNAEKQGERADAAATQAMSQAEAARAATTAAQTTTGHAIDALGGWKTQTDVAVAQARSSVEDQLRQLAALQYALEHTRTFMFSEDKNFQKLAGTPFEVRVPDVTNGSTLNLIELRFSETREDVLSKENWQLGESQRFEAKGKQYVLRFSFAQDHASPFSDYYALELTELLSQPQAQPHARVAEATRSVNPSH